MLPCEHEVRLDGPLDRLVHLGIGLVDDLAHLLADPLLPVGQTEMYASTRGSAS